MGVQHVCVGWDVRVLHDWFTEQGKAMRDVLSAAVGATVAEPGVTAEPSKDPVTVGHY